MSVIIIWLAVLVLYVAAWWKIFEKAGQPGWAAIIPIYNYYIITRIIGKPGWWVVMMFLPLANIIFLIWALNLLSKSFGKDEAFTVGLVLLGIVFVPILGFGEAQYVGQSARPSIGTLDDPFRN
ncbi:MAG: DUF5684 domain-containing protein [Flavobacteriales bacterium]|nr:DUF5684 domain-containing protein [Flavobacteriales bacterium]